MACSLVVQLARVGDLLQSLPAIAALRTRDPAGRLDLLCAGSLVPLAQLFPGIDEVVGWDGARWRRWAEAYGTPGRAGVMEAERYVDGLCTKRYELSYVLNQHLRAVLAGALLAEQIRGPVRGRSMRR